MTCAALSQRVTTARPKCRQIAAGEPLFRIGDDHRCYGARSVAASTREVSRTRRGEPRLPGVLALLWLLALEGLVLWRLTPPAVRADGAPPGEFSALRAEAVLRRLAPSDEPHPGGSAEQTRFRARLLAELERLGLEPTVQPGVACSPEGTCAEVHNVVAAVPGTSGSAPVALMAHYDSVPAGPGIGDDGQGVASVLEIARSLTAAPLPRGVLLVFTDGEELGLLGARLFVDEHPASDSLRAVVNLEARGTRGPSLMFETTPGSSWLIERYESSPRPVASSLFAAAYQALPNDTDLSVLARRGIQGLNFAFVGGVEHYHTPRDDLATLDWRSVQQQGAAALATVRSISEHGTEPAGADAVFFDLLSTRVVRLPAGLMAPAAGLALLLLAGCVAAELRSERRYAIELGRAFVALLGAWALPALLAAMLGGVLALLGALPFPIVAHPGPLLLALLLLASAGAALSHGFGPTSARASFDVTWLTWSGAGLLLALVWPLVSYLAVLPGLVAGVARLVMRLGRRAWVQHLCVLACATAAGLLWLSPLSLLYPTLGFTSPTLLALAFSVGLSALTPALAPLLGGRRLPIALGATGVAVGLSQLAWPVYSADVPQRLALVLEVEATGKAHWLADANGPLPSTLGAAAEFSARPARPHPWPGYGQASMFTAPADVKLGGPAPAVLRTLGPSSLRLETELPDSSWALGVRLPSSVKLSYASWRGKRLVPVGARAEQRFTLVPGSDRFIALDLEVEGDAPKTLELVELRRGLPRTVHALEHARGAAAVTSGMGDLTVLRSAASTE